MVKNTGLGAFIKTGAHQEHDVKPESVKKAKPDLKQVLVRVPQKDWPALAHLAVDEDTTIQALLMEGIAEVFKKRGLVWPS